MANEKEEKAKGAAKPKRPTPLKRDLQNARRRQNNQVFKSRIKTAIRQLEESLEGKDANLQTEKLNTVASLMDKGVKKGVITLNKASRTKSRLTTRLSSKA